MKNAPVNSQNVSAQRKAVPESGFQPVSPAVWRHGNTAFLQYRDHSPADVLKRAMLRTDSAVAPHFGDSVSDFQHPVQYVSSPVSEKHNVPGGKSPGIFHRFENYGVPSSAYERQHADSFHRNRDTTSLTEHPQDLREKQIVVYHEFFHNISGSAECAEASAGHKFTKKSYICPVSLPDSARRRTDSERFMTDTIRYENKGRIRIA